MQRRDFLKSTAAASGFASTPLAVDSVSISNSQVSTLVREHALLGFDPPDEAIESGRDQHPEWIVHYGEDDEDLDALESWLDEDDRDRIQHDESGRAMVVRASAGDMGVLWLDRLRSDGLAGEDWIEHVDLNIRMSRPEDVDLATEDEVALSTRERIRSRQIDGKPTDGMAFDDDAVEVSMDDIREIHGVDEVSVAHDSVTVAVLDTGFNHAGGAALGADHEDRILGASKDVISGDTVEDEGLDAIEDGDGHGTFVASQILADPSSGDDAHHEGILPDADLLALRVLNDDGEGSAADIAEGIRYAADQGADVACLSLGSPMYSVEIHRAIEYARDEGMIVVAAVGNDRQGSRWVATPASAEDAIGVSSLAVDEEDELRMATYPNIGPHPGTTDFSDGETVDSAPDVAAIGTEVEALVASTGNSRRERTLTGTSMAAPVVAGIAGLLVADGVTDFEDVRDRLTDYAEPVENAGETEVGAGLAHAARALDEDEPDEDQEAARISGAEDRDSMYRTMSDTQGRRLTAWL